MNKLENLQKSLASFDILLIIREVLKREDVGKVLIAIIQKRLYYKGETVEGDKLRTDFAKSSNKRLKGTKGFYSRNTETIKKSKGQKIDNVTLNDTGEFYESFKTDFKSNSLELSADFRDIYDNFKDSFSSDTKFEDAILDITDEEKEQLFDFMYPLILEKINKWLVTV